MQKRFLTGGHSRCQKCTALINLRDCDASTTRSIQDSSEQRERGATAQDVQKFSRRALNADNSVFSKLSEMRTSRYARSKLNLLRAIQRDSAEFSYAIRHSSVAKGHDSSKRTLSHEQRVGERKKSASVLAELSEQKLNAVDLFLCQWSRLSESIDKDISEFAPL